MGPDQHSHLVPGSMQGSVPALDKSFQGNFCSIRRAWLLSLESSPCLVHPCAWFILLPSSSSLLVHLPASPFELQHGPEPLFHGDGSSSGKRRGCPTAMPGHPDFVLLWDAERVGRTGLAMPSLGSACGLCWMVACTFPALGVLHKALL